MPRPKKDGQVPTRTPLLNTRLGGADYIKLEQICRLEGKTKTEILRQATLEFIDRYDQEATEQAANKLVQALEKVEQQRRRDVDRLAKLIIRATVDVGILNQVFYKRAAKEERDKLWDAAKTAALERLKFKRKDGDSEVTEVLKDATHSS
jgi:hypothetical protein